MAKSTTPKLIPISVAQHEHSTIIVYRENADAISLRVAVSTDGIRFKLSPTPLIIVRTLKEEDLRSCDHFRLSVVHDEYILSYEKKSIVGTKQVITAHSKNLHRFKVHAGVLAKVSHSGFAIGLTATTAPKKEYLLYHGSPTITAASSHDLDNWTANGALLISPRPGFFDHSQLRIIAAHSTIEGIAVMYESRSYDNGKEQLLVGGALFAHANPFKVLWRSEMPLWEHEFEKTDIADAKNASGAAPIWSACGAIFKKESILIYLASRDGDLSVVAVPNKFATLANKKHKQPSHIDRHHSNPIVTPTEHHSWQSHATFNPAAFEVDGRIHLLYRAMGPDGVSRLGHSSSEDGSIFDERSAHPVFEPSAGFGLPPAQQASKASIGPRRYDPIFYSSGGGWAGCEDPRAVIIDNKIYVTYVAFEGWNSVRIALTSISLEDFNNRHWNWDIPKLISAQGEMHKNWVLFPEKIAGKYAILHCITPHIKVEYVDDLAAIKSTSIKSTPPSGGRKNFWDNKVRGAGPPPLRTELGWLLLYHATDLHDPNKYKLGAMILDINDPTKILYRSYEPILVPEMPYENDWKPGVVYASGAVIRDDNLLVYYGGGDKNICLAETPLKKLLDWLVAFGKVS